MRIFYLEEQDGTGRKNKSVNEDILRILPMENKILENMIPKVFS